MARSAHIESLASVPSSLGLLWKMLSMIALRELHRTGVGGIVIDDEARTVDSKISNVEGKARACAHAHPSHAFVPAFGPQAPLPPLL